MSQSIALDTFDDHGANTILNGTYAGITWGTNAWDVDGPIATDATNSISFNSATVTGEPFSFTSPQVLLSAQVYSNSNTTAMITLSCAGNPTVDATVAPDAATTLTTDWQTPCTTVTVTSSNSWNTNLDNLVYSSIPDSTLPPTPPPPPANTYGYTTQGAQLDTGDAGYMNGSRFTTSSSSRTVQSISVFVGNVDSGSHNQYQVAIYTDNSGVPGTLVAQSGTGTLAPTLLEYASPLVPACNPTPLTGSCTTPTRPVRPITSTTSTLIQGVRNCGMGQACFWVLADQVPVGDAVQHGVLDVRDLPVSRAFLVGRFISRGGLPTEGADFDENRCQRRQERHDSRDSRQRTAAASRLSQN